MGGIYNTVNFHLYHYAGNNPIRYIDPDGNEIKEYYLLDTDILPYFYADGKNISDWLLSPIYTIDNIITHGVNSVVGLYSIVDEALLGVGIDMRALGSVSDAYTISMGLKNIGPTLSYLSTMTKTNNSNFNPVKAIVQAAFGRGNFGIGSATRAEADTLGRAWVGEGAREMSNGKGLVSADGTKTYRYPTAKSSSYATTGVQANLERLENGKVVGNAHINITD